MKTNLVWFRNALRTIDNNVLSEAIKHSDEVIGVYCFDKRQFEADTYGFIKTGKYRAQFLIETDENLKSRLSPLNIDLLVYHDLPELIIPELCAAYNVGGIYFQKEWTQQEVDVENAVKSRWW